MSTSTPLEAIFFAALQIGSRKERDAYLDEACAGNPDLRDRVAKMLVAQGRAGSFLEVPAAELGKTIDQTLREGPGDTIGPYRLLEQIGEGGMGTVFMAEQLKPVHRKVALKVIKAGMDTRQVIARFDAERQALALMDHQHIAKVYDAGMTASGLPYFVMELVRGIPITQFCDEHQLTIRERLELFVTVCHAAQHAHQKGIIHRDIKPSNVMVTMHDDRPVVKVIDFGVAKATSGQLTDMSLFTGFMQMVGTPMYMSPEQTALSGADVDTRSDIYSLGVLLYELLTGTTPFDRRRLDAAALDEVWRIIREEEPNKPSTRLSAVRDTLASVAAQRHIEPKKLSQLLRGDLDWIVMKALEKDRTRRYETANGMARDVQRYLADEVVEAGPPSATYRLRKFVRRNRASFATAVVIAVFLVVGVVGLSIGTAVLSRANTEIRQANSRIQAESEEKEVQRRLAVAGKAEATRQLYVAQINLAQKAWNENNVGRTRELLSKLKPENTGGVDLRGWEWNYLWRLSHSELRTLDFRALRVAFTPDGKSLISGSWEGELKMWDLNGFREMWSIKAHDDRIDGLAVSNDGRLLVTGSPDGKVKLWEIATHRLTRTWDCAPYWSNSVKFSPDGTLLTMNAPGLSLWSTVNGKKLTEFEGRKFCSDIAFSPDGHQLATISRSPTCTLWDVSSGRSIRDFGGHGVRVTSFAFSPDGQHLTVGYRDGSLIAWNVATGEKSSEFTGHTNEVTRVQFSRDGKRIVIAGSDSSIRIWDTATAREIGNLRGHESSVGDVCLSPSEEVIASAGWDGTIRLWDAASRQEPRTLEIPGTGISSISFSSDVKWLAIGCNLGTKVADASTGLPLRRNDDISSHPLIATASVSFHPDGQLLASGLDDGRVELQTVSNGIVVRTIKASNSSIATICFSGDGRLLATGSDSREVTVWNVHDGRRVALFEGHSDGVSAVAFSPDGKYLASGGLENDKTIILWDIAAGRKVRPLVGHEGAVTCVQFSRDGNQLFSGSVDEMIRVWDVESGASVHVYRAHAGTTYGLALSPDGQRLATCSIDQSVKLWDVTTWQELQTLNTQGGILFSVAFSPDGTRLAAGGSLRVLNLWDARPLTDELRIEHSAADHVESLFAEHVLQKNVIRELKDDPAISDALRDKSLELAGRWQVDPNEINNQSWKIVSQPGPTASQVQLALALSEQAVELSPKSAAFYNTLGVAHFRAGDWDAAENALRKSMQLNNGGNAFDWFFLAMADWQLGQKERARQWFDAACLWTAKYGNKNEVLVRFQAETQALLGITDPMIPDKIDDTMIGNALSAADPELVSYRVFKGRAEAHIRAFEWTAAKADAIRAAEMRPDDLLFQYPLAALLARVGDEPAYRNQCRMLFAQCNESTHPVWAERIAKVSLLLPVSGADLDAASRLAETAVKSGKDVKIDEGKSFMPFAQVACALAAYRRRDFSATVQWCDKALAGESDGYWFRNAEAYFLRALAAANLGDRAAAQTDFTKAAEILRAAQTAAKASPVVDPVWHDMAICELLQHEAELKLSEAMK